MFNTSSDTLTGNSSVIYSLVARGNGIVLSHYTNLKGNFQQVAQDVLHKTTTSKIMEKFGTGNYMFYKFHNEGITFMVMVDASYQMRIAISFLKIIQEEFFKKYDATTRNTAVAHQLKSFDSTLKNQMNRFCDVTKVDKLSQLTTVLKDVEKQAMDNMTNIIIRGQKMQIMVQKSRDMNELSYDIQNLAKQTRRKMWWKNKKIMIGIIGVIVLIIIIIIIIATTV